jgi:glycosyltransferase involved in cell wall biosynthesis
MVRGSRKVTDSRSESIVVRRTYVKVLFDGYWWVEGPAANRTVLREFITEWHDSFPDDEIAIAVPKKNFAAARAEISPDIRVHRLRLWPHALATVVELSLLARRGFDVVISHNYSALHKNSVVVIQDLLFEEHPEWFSRPERVYFWPMSRLAATARQVLTSTKTEARRIERLHPNLKVHPIGLAVSNDLLTATPVRPGEVKSTGEFALSVGRLNARKNLQRALDGSLQSGRISPHTPMYVVGSGSASSVGAKLSSSVLEGVRSGAIVFLGRVTDGELRWLYENTRVTIYMSLDEGFGLPPIEAAQFGSPVLVSDIDVFHETVGQVAVFAAPMDVDAIAENISLAWDDTFEARSHRVSRMAELHSWKESVSKLRMHAEQYSAD